MVNNFIPSDFLELVEHEWYFEVDDVTAYRDPRNPNVVHNELAIRSNTLAMGL
jgi:hypothetical protein